MVSLEMRRYILCGKLGTIIAVCIDVMSEGYRLINRSISLNSLFFLNDQIYTWNEILLNYWVHLPLKLTTA